jgi:hypothetical protein
MEGYSSCRRWASEPHERVIVAPALVPAPPTLPGNDRLMRLLRQVDQQRRPRRRRSSAAPLDAWGHRRQGDSSGPGDRLDLVDRAQKHWALRVRPI